MTDEIKELVNQILCEKVENLVAERLNEHFKLDVREYMRQINRDAEPWRDPLLAKAEKQFNDKQAAAKLAWARIRASKQARINNFLSAAVAGVVAGKIIAGARPKTNVVEEGFMGAISGIAQGVAGAASSHVAKKIGINPKTISSISRMAKRGWQGGAKKPSVGSTVKLSASDAHDILSNHGGVGTAFHQLSSQHRSSLSSLAKDYGHKNTVMFHAHLNNLASQHQGIGASTQKLPPAGGRMTAAAYRQHVGLPPAGSKP